MSNEQWIDNLPSSWAMARLGALGGLSKGSGGSKEDNRDTGVAVVRYGELYGKFDRVIREAQSFISPDDVSRYTPLPTGSLVFAGSGEDPEEIGKSALSLLPAPAFVGGDSIILSPRIDVVNPFYLTYVLDSRPLRAYKAVRSTGFTVVHISAGKLKTLPIPLPPLEEQRAIADYLDHETAKIDALVAKQEEFIGLLRERRAAVRAEALATSILRDRDSYSDGDAWPLVPTRRLLALGPSNGVSPETARVGDLRSLSVGAVRDGVVCSSEDVTKYVDRSSVKEVTRLLLRRDDVLIVRGNGNFNYVGRAGLVGEDFCRNEYIYPDLLMRVRTTPRMLPEFFVAAFEAPSSRAQIELLARTTVGTFKVSAADVRSIRLPLPPIDEQLRIVERINEQTSRIDTLIAKAEEHIALAKERRSALITAAVTGQIDVRAAAQKAS